MNAKGCCEKAIRVATKLGSKKELKMILQANTF